MPSTRIAPSAQIKSPDFCNWHITADQEPLHEAFEKIITGKSKLFEEKYLSGNLLKEDLVAALELFYEHINKKPATPYEIKLRYRHENGETTYILCKGTIISWDKNGSRFSVF